MELTLDQIITQLFALVAAIVSVTTLLRNKHIHLAEKRLKDVISPLFEELEPCMKKDHKEENNLQIIEKVCSTIKRKTYLSGGELRRYLLLYELEKFSSAELPGLCHNVSDEYDRLCNSLDIPLRSEKYRKENYTSCFQTHYFSNGDTLLTATSLFFTGLLILQIILRTITPYGENAPHEYFMVDHTVMFVTSCITAFFAILIRVRAKLRKGA